MFVCLVDWGVDLVDLCVNLWGSGILIGYLFGVIGVRMLVIFVYELFVFDGCYVFEMMCIGGG